MRYLYLFALCLVVISYQNCGGGFENNNSSSLNLSTGNSDPGVAGNIPPTASITTPTPGQQFNAGSAVPVTISARDSDGTITRVELRINGQLYGTPDTTAPYSFNVAGLLVGSHILSARAVDNVGGTTNTAEIQITINAVVNDPLANCTAPDYRLPSWQDASTVSATYYVGLDRGGPTAPLSILNSGALNLAYTPVNGTRAVSAIDCSNPNNGIDRDCNLARLAITRNNNAECSSGTTTITARPNDGCPNKVFPPKVFNITVVNACPISDVVDAGTAAETQAAFGSRVAIDGDTMVVSAPNANGAASRSGAAYVFRRTGSSTSNANIDTNNWTPEGGRIAPVNAVANEGLFAVAVRGNLIALGAPGVSGLRGAVYVYERSGTTWNQLTKIIQPNVENPSDFTQFGFQVAIQADQSIIIGAPGEDHGGLINAGAVYIYTRSGSTYNQARRLVASPAIASENFGFNFSATSSVLAISAPFVASQENTSNYGSAYIFTGSGANFSQSRRLRLTSTTSILQFGRAIHTDGTTVAVGTPVRNNSTGGVYLFSVANGTLLNTNPVIHGGSATDDRFGTSVFVSGNTLYASAPGDEVQTGALYRFSFSGGTATQNFNFISRVAQRAQGALFGNSFAVSGNNIAVGSPGRISNNQNNAGVGFVLVAP